MPATGHEPAPVLVAFDPPVGQRRWTALARPVLVLPHLLVLLVVGPLAVVMAVLGWVGALVTGRLPTFAAHYLSGFLRFQTRLYAYLFLLTDAYPPLTLADGPYPVRVTTRPGPLNRAAVAFRFLLALPAVLVAATVTYGIGTIVLVATWASVSLTGRFPPSLHQVFAAFVRYEARVVGYLTMVTSEYPWGLLGDPDTTARSPGSSAAFWPDGPALSPDWQPAPPSPVVDPYWRVVLSARAKNLVVFVLVLGVASVMAFNVARAAASYDHLHTDETASTSVQNAYRTLTAAVVQYQSETRLCDSTTVPLRCLTGAAETVSGAFTAFTHQLAVTAMPPGATAAQALLVSDSARAEEDFADLSTSTSTGHYQLVIESTNLPSLLIRFDDDYEALGTKLAALG